MKKICIALDTSPAAEKIAKIGYSYVEALNAEIILVHVVNDASFYAIDYGPIMGYDGYLIRSSIQLVDDLHKEAKKFLGTTAKYLGEPDLKVKVLEGDAHDAILEFTKEWGADLLILGTHSQSRVENLLLGNIAAKIVRHSEIPLLVIPTKELI
tara:strand:+ start:9403 stop:9864 length:462 start_codon:yes stop_codon:yes gene_type:complete